MAGKRFSAEQIIMKLREAEVGLAQGQRVGQVSKQIRPHSALAYRPPAPEAKLPRSQALDLIPWSALQMAPSLT